MPGKNVEMVQVVYFAALDRIRITVDYQSETFDGFQTVDMRLDAAHRAGRELASRRLKVLARKCFDDRSGRVRPFLAGHVGWLWERCETPLEGS